MIQYEPIKILFSIGKFNVYSWGIMFVIAFLTTLFLILREAKKQKISSLHIYNIALIVILGIVIGSRLFYVIENFKYFLLNPFEVFAISYGGMASYGGLFLALFFGWLYIRKQKDLSFTKILDLFAPYIALGLVIGRIGCFLNWCCYGKESSLPWAIMVHGTARHPTQIYLLLANLVIFFILISFKKIREKKNEKDDKYKKTKFKQLIEKPGTLFLFLLLFYSIFRIFIDFFRVYETYLLGLALSQWMLIVIFIFSFVILVKKS